MFLEVLPTLEMITPAKLKNNTCIVIDVFRATSTIVTAIYNGCDKIIPCNTIETARQTAGELGTEVLTGGERRGHPIPGFQLGNSPCEYTASAVKGKTIVLSTTNGTTAINIAALHGECVLIGSFLNIQAAAKMAHSLGRNIAIICAGTVGRLSLEDTLAAGTIVRCILELDGNVELLYDNTLLAYRLSLSYGDSPEKGLFDTYNGKRLRAMGKGKDILRCAQPNRCPVVPVWKSGKIVRDI